MNWVLLMVKWIRSLFRMILRWHGQKIRNSEYTVHLCSMCLMSCCNNVNVFSKKSNGRIVTNDWVFFSNTNHFPLIVFIILFCHTRSFYHELLIVYHKNCYSSPRHWPCVLTERKLNQCTILILNYIKRFNVKLSIITHTCKMFWYWFTE